MRRYSVGLLLLALSGSALFAADQADPNAPPERGVARVSLLNGDVSVRRGDSGDVLAAALNAPLSTEDRVLTGSSARAEVQFDSANMIRVGSNSELHLTSLEYRRSLTQLAIGTVTLRVLRDTDAQIEVDTPILGVHPIRQGTYRITVREDGSTEITVRDGEAEILTQRGTERVRAGSTMLARGTTQDPEFQIVAPLGGDEFDHWNQMRDQDLLRSISQRYVGPDINGAEELDQNGRWVNDPSYGQVWAPTVSADWAPYRAGRWVWEDYYGWTWVSSDPWGWAPYHYGRWFYGNAGWCWFPGRLYERHYWSPALVAFFGFGGGGGGIGFGFGNVGWVPLGPYEAFHPWWGRGFYGNHTTIINNTRIINNTNIVSAYRNARVANGVTSVAAANFGRGGARFANVNGSSIQGAGLVRGVLPVSPDRSSLRYSDRGVQSGSYVQSRATSFYGRGGQQSSYPRVSFDQQQRTMQQVSRATSFGGGAAEQYRSSPVPSQAQTAGHGWRTFGEPVQHSSTAAQQIRSGYSAPATAAAPVYRGSAAPAAPSYSGRPIYQPSSQPTSRPAPETSAPSYNLGGRSNYQAAPQPNYRPVQAAPSYQGGRSFGGYSGGSSQPVRISPPIVHERSAPASAPRSNAPSNSGGSNRGGRGR